ncbi:hypothetical protein B9T25_08375 [Acinetobacter sp. ANC 4470]|uniref:hypothetical protein n=1 Tax=Acinetobacter sp. ANC 4470 TaxID=1977881 RepID=UPI000A33D1CE|nr:hypothetical protein [Acinetobacter sp. ANC 4470]OTG67981.1 hypothetical protein B9T25_08375 [Acinetobacter sp. ANC 4470]
MTDNTSPEKSPWGWKALIIAFILSAFFLGFFYLAISNEPDYMPSQKRAESNQTAFKNAPVMSQEALTEAEKQKNLSEASASATTEAPHMPADEHAGMAENKTATESEQGH